MTIETRYGLGDLVYGVTHRYGKTWKPCEFCGASGGIEGADGSARDCPECYGDKGTNEWGPRQWFVDDMPMTVGQVRTTHTQGRFFKIEREEEYMLAETGVGSGRVWKVENLFWSYGDAEDACAERNAVEEVPA